MKNHIAIILGIIGIIALLAIIVLAFMLLHHPDKVPQLPNVAKIMQPSQHPLLVVDFDNNGLLDEAELLRGKDAVLAVKQSGSTQELFNSLATLQRLDFNKDGWIDAHDPIFSQLELVFFSSDGKQKRYVPFSQAGISAINLNRQRLKQSNLSIAILDVNDNTLGEAITADGKPHAIRVIMVGTLR